MSLLPNLEGFEGLDNLDSLDVLENSEPLKTPSSHDNIIDIANHESAEIIKRLNAAKIVEKADEVEEKRLYSHMEDRRRLSELLESDPEFRKQYLAEQESKFINSKTLESQETLDKAETQFPEIVSENTKKIEHGKNIIYISNVQNLTLNFA